MASYDEEIRKAKLDLLVRAIVLYLSGKPMDLGILGRFAAEYDEVSGSADSINPVVSEVNLTALKDGDPEAWDALLHLAQGTKAYQSLLDLSPARLATTPD